MYMDLMVRDITTCLQTMISLESESRSLKKELDPSARSVTGPQYIGLDISRTEEKSPTPDLNPVVHPRYLISDPERSSTVGILQFLN